VKIKTRKLYKFAAVILLAWRPSEERIQKNRASVEENGKGIKKEFLENSLKPPSPNLNIHPDRASSPDDFNHPHCFTVLVNRLDFIPP